MAASTGLEPATLVLTARRSTIELQGNDSPPGWNRTNALLFFTQALLPTELPGDNESGGN